MAEAEAEVEDEAYSKATQEEDVELAESSYKDVDDDVNDELEPLQDEDEAEAEAGVSNPLDAVDGYTLLVMLLVMNIVEFVAAIVYVTPANEPVGWWAFSGGLLSILTVVVMMILRKCSEHLSLSAAPFLSIWLSVLWIAVVLPCTFGPPFASFGNGYIGSWGSLICAGTLTIRAFADRVTRLQRSIATQTQSDTGKWTVICGVASAIVMIAGSFKVGDSTGDPSESTGDTSLSAYSVSVSVISVIACVVILVFVNVESLKRHSGVVNTAVSIFLALWWVIGAFVMTFVNPFNLNATCEGFNGYLATFAATFGALRLFECCGLDFVKSRMANLRSRAGRGGGVTAATEGAPDEDQEL